MNVLRGYVYESNNPYMPIVALVFDEADNIIGSKVIENAEEGAKFIADAVASCDRASRACAGIAEAPALARRSTTLSEAA